MTSLFASQLQAIAKKSTNELDLATRRSAHAESLLFEKSIAAKQDFQTIYAICADGFRELCQLDPQFRDFDRNLFSEHAKDQDREQMDKAENQALDTVLNRCLALLGSKVLLKPGIKAVEWLVRRFRVHVYNVDALLNTFLPYHEMSVWANVLSIVPNDKIVAQWKFLRPYVKTTWNVPRHAIVYAAINNDAFFTIFNAYTLGVCREGFVNPALLRFWSGIVVEAISNRLTQTRSGRKEVEKQRTEDLLLKILPLLSDIYEIAGNADLLTTSYTIIILLAVRGNPSDAVIDSLLDAVAKSMSHVNADHTAVLMTIALAVAQKQNKVLPRKVVEKLAKLGSFDNIVHDLARTTDVQQFLLIIVDSAILHLRDKNASLLLAFVEIVIKLTAELYTALLPTVFAPIVDKVFSCYTANDERSGLEQHLTKFLQDLNESETFADAVASASNGREADLEKVLSMTVSKPTVVETMIATDVDMIDHEQIDQQQGFAFSTLPVTVPFHSFLTRASRDFYDHFATAFAMTDRESSSIGRFNELPIWTNSGALRVSLLLRLSLSGSSVHIRTNAIRHLLVSHESGGAGISTTLAVHLVTLLTDRSLHVRKLAAEQLARLRQALSTAQDSGFDINLYDEPTKADISLLQLGQVLDEFVLTVMEECILDGAYIRQHIRSFFDGHSKQEAKKSHKQILFNLLSSHALATPLFKVKAVVVDIFGRLEKVGSKSVSGMLTPIITEWTSYDDTNARRVVQEEGLDLDDLDTTLTLLINLRDRQQISTTLTSAREGIVRSLCERVRASWRQTKVDDQTSLSNMLYNSAFSGKANLAIRAQALLRSLDVPTQALDDILSWSMTLELDSHPSSSKKRRRSSQNAMTGDAPLEGLALVTLRITLALELVDGNTPETKPELLRGLFDLLRFLNRSQSTRLDSPYLLDLCLRNALAIIENVQTCGKSIDVSSIDPELVTNCLQHSDNPQVQNDALLLAAGLCMFTPDNMVHSIMPIFTIMAGKMLGKDDEHTVNVINAVVDKIVPALVQSLRKAKRPLAFQQSMTGVVSSFTSAVDHVDPSRRVAFYQRLLLRMGAQEFAYMVLTMLMMKKQYDAGVEKFLQDIVSNLHVVVQLTTYHHLLSLCLDIFTKTPQISTHVFSTMNDTSVGTKSRHAQIVLRTAGIVLRSNRIVSDLVPSQKSNTGELDDVRIVINKAFKHTLTALQRLKVQDPGVVTGAKQCLEDFLKFLPLTELLSALFGTLDEMEDELKIHALRLLAVQVESRRSRSNHARDSAMAFLKKISAYLHTSPDVSLVQPILLCQDKIVDLYGRKEPEVVINTATTIVEYSTLSHSASIPPIKETQALIFLTLGSMIEAIGESSIPIVVLLMPHLLEVLTSSSAQDDDRIVFEAVCTLLGSIYSHASFVVTEEQTVQVVLHVFGRDSEQTQQVIKVIAQNIELEPLLAALGTALESSRTIHVGITNCILAALDEATKSAVQRNADNISRFFLTLLELEAIRTQKIVDSDGKSLADAGVNDKLKEASIKYVYKLNDTTFRPLFESWVEWCTAESSLQPLRQIVLFDLLTHFFDTLKAIVTSYATYLIRPIASNFTASVPVSSKGSPKAKALSLGPVQQALQGKTLKLLQSTTSHDLDSFHASPSHFEPIVTALVGLLKLAATKSLRALVSHQVVPTIVSLARSTLDVPNTHHTLVSLLTKLRHESSAHVRLASIQTIRALTDADELGEEFIANTIGVGSLGEGEGARGGGSSVGELMIYVNEMLEDDDENVEKEVRRWVQGVRERVGEDIFEM